MAAVVADVHESHRNGSVTETGFNSKFAGIAASLTPILHERIDRPLEVIKFVTDNSKYFKHSARHALSISELSTREWSQGGDFILDFGSHRVGYLGFRLDAVNADAPCRLRFVFGETPYDVIEDLHHSGTGTSSSWLPDEVVNVDWLPTEVSLPRRYSFRFVRIQVLATSPRYSVVFKDIQVMAVSAVDPDTAVSPLPIDDGELREIDNISMTTLRDCMQTVFEDGPRRDRRLWLGDLRLQALSNYHTFKNFQLVKRCLYLFAAVPRDDSSLPAAVYEFPKLRRAPDYIVDYDALFGPTVYDYVLASGDMATGYDLWTTVLSSMKVPLSHLDPVTKQFDGSRSSHWKFCDWAADLDTDASMHGIVLFACKRVNALSCLLFPSETSPFEAEVQAMTSAAWGFLHRGEDKGLFFVSGPNAQVSWSSAAWLCLAEALPRAVAKDALLGTLNHLSAVKPLTPYCFHHVVEALAIVGAETQCVKLMRKYWGGMVDAGADTFWECFDPEDSRKSPYGDCHNNSYCHAWSCTPSYLLRGVLKEWFSGEKELVANGSKTGPSVLT